MLHLNISARISLTDHAHLQEQDPEQTVLVHLKLLTTSQLILLSTIVKGSSQHAMYSDSVLEIYQNLLVVFKDLKKAIHVC